MTVFYIPWAHGTNYSSDLEVVQLPLSIRRVGGGGGWGEQTRGCLLLTIVEVSGICKSSCRVFFREYLRGKKGGGVSVRKLVTKKRGMPAPHLVWLHSPNFWFTVPSTRVSKILFTLSPEGTDAGRNCKKKPLIKFFYLIFKYERGLWEYEPQYVLH